MRENAAKNRQKPPKKRRPYKSDTVRTRIIARHVGGQSNREIAKEEGIDRDTVSRVLSQDDAVKMTKRYRWQVLDMMPEAIKVYKQLLHSKDERVRAAAATKILEGLQIFSKSGVFPEQTTTAQDNNQKKLLFLGQLADMMLSKERAYGVPLPPKFDELKELYAARSEGSKSA